MAHINRKQLQDELQEDCQSLEYMVRGRRGCQRGSGRGPACACRLHSRPRGAALGGNAATPMSAPVLLHGGGARWEGGGARTPGAPLCTTALAGDGWVDPSAWTLSFPAAAPVSPPPQPRTLQVSEIDRSLDAAEANPARFRLSQAELSDRRRWVIATRRQVSGLAEALATARKEAAAPPAERGARDRLAAAVQAENERFIDAEAQRQQVIMRQQDEDLDVLGQHVSRIGELGREMGQELHMQGQVRGLCVMGRGDGAGVRFGKCCWEE